MKNANDILSTYISDMMAFEKGFFEALDRQVKDEKVRTQPQASRLIERIHQTTKAHLSATEQRLHILGGSLTANVKEAVGTLAGIAAGMIDKVRTHAVSKMLRDDYTALSMAAISYTMLHTTGLALRDQATADLALRHLREITPLIVELSEMVPSVVVNELAGQTTDVNSGVAGEAVRNTHQTWTRESIDR